MKIGLVLAGGFARGAAQGGFLKGMLNYLNRDEITLMSCASIGGLNGIALSCDNMDYCEWIYRNGDFGNIKNLKINLKNNLVTKIIHEITDDHQQVQIPMYVNGTCLNTISTHYFYIDENTPKEDIFKATNITVTFPFVNGLFRKEYKKLYLDGGGTDNIPVYPFYYHKMDLIIILHCYPHYIPPKKLLNCTNTVIDIDIAARCKDGISTYSMQTENLNHMFSVGYEYGLEFGKRVLQTRDLATIKEEGQKFIREEAEIRKKKKTPITAAIFFNKIQQSRWNS